MAASSFAHLIGSGLANGAPRQPDVPHLKLVEIEQTAGSVQASEPRCCVNLLTHSAAAGQGRCAVPRFYSLELGTYHGTFPIQKESLAGAVV